MKINIAPVLKNEGAVMNISGHVNLGSFDFMGSPIEFRESVSVDGTISNIGGTIELSAAVKGRYHTVCSRCGDEITVDVNEQLFERARNDFDDADTECLSLSGSILDIRGAVDSCVFGAIGLKFLCSESCKGLCPVCGTNLNEKECNCDRGI